MEDGEWIMRGMDWDNPARIQSWEDLIRWIDEIGFLPLFQNEVAGFSAEENTAGLYWWTGNPDQAPREWCALNRPQRPGGLRQFFRQTSRFYLQSLVPALCQLASGWL